METETGMYAKVVVRTGIPRCQMREEYRHAVVFSWVFDLQMQKLLNSTDDPSPRVLDLSHDISHSFCELGARLMFFYKMPKRVLAKVDPHMVDMYRQQQVRNADPTSLARNALLRMQDRTRCWRPTDWMTGVTRHMC